MSIVRMFLLGMVIMAMIAAVMALSNVPAYPHDASTGWTYPTDCCSNFDCREVPENSVSQVGDKWIAPSGEQIQLTDRRVRFSPDGLFHWCSSQGRDDTRTICLFVPMQAY